MNSIIVNKTWCYLNRHFNLKVGSISGFATGCIVFAININHGFLPAFASFWKQFIFNVIMASYNTKTCEKLAGRISNRALSLTAASVIPTVQAFIILFAVHYLGGTPKPGASTLWQVVANLAIFFCMALIFRGEMNVFNSNLFRFFKSYRVKNYLKTRKIRRLRSTYNKQAV